jgi:CheY-like chemotaxis protein
MPRKNLPRANVRPHQLASLKVLVVDDNANVQRLIGDVLRAGGVGQVETVGDGVRAREMLSRWRPDIVFSDWSMPVMGGLELTRSIRRAAIDRDPQIPDPQVPVIIVTGHRSERDVEIARRAGVNEFVIKPFTPAALLSRIELVLTRPRPFIVGDAYIGPDRRRRVELSYSGPLRRTGDPAEVVDADERAATRETIGVELEALAALIAARGGLDRDTLKMVQRVMQHTRFRARQVRDIAVERASGLLADYVEAAGGAPHRCEAAVLTLHFEAIRTLLASPERDEARAAALVDRLEATVRRRIGQRAAA